MKFAVAVFPGTNCDRETLHVLKNVFGQTADPVWHEDTDLGAYDCVVLPGGFAHGDHLRAGAIARFSPIMQTVERFARGDRLVWGICNGFQVLLEAGLLPGAMLPNAGRAFVSSWVHCRIEGVATPFTAGIAPGRVLRLPIAHGEGRYYAPPETLRLIERRGQVALRYCLPDGQLTDPANPNGALANVAGLSNEGGNVFALMPHPERASEPELASQDGRALFESLLGSEPLPRPPPPAGGGGAGGGVRPGTGRVTLTDAPPSASRSPHPALSDAEYATICERLRREPNGVELGMLAAMWSEHCGYKNSRALLKRLPTEGPRVVQGPGENAGAVDIGDGLLVVLKMESHNHPSAVEPFQGAATGVGGILRDIFTMGARPIALLDSLRFGPLDADRTRYLFGGVVGGIGHYGNCIGVPTVGGEIFFDPSYAENPLVNAMCVGLARHDELTRARASTPGDAVLVVGAATGRDGIHGATFASAELDDAREARRPAVQVGNPFLEKLLLEACLALLETGTVRAMQDLGAAGLTSSGIEVAARGGRGMRIDVARVSRRETGMTPYEVMLSESQERMLLVLPPEAVATVRAHFAQWELHSDVVGEIADDGLIRVLDDGREVACLPISLLTDEVPAYVREVMPTPSPAPPTLPPEPTDRGADVGDPTFFGAALLRLLGSPNICSREPVFRGYDHTVQANTMIEPGFGAAVVRIRGTSKALALTTDCNPRYCAADPRRGAQIAVAEAARNLACRGAEPIAVTDCLNFGNPERPEAYWQLSEAIDGLATACRALGVPVVSGNVSLYNETNGLAIAPTPIVGMVGLIEDRARVVDSGFRAEGDVVLLLGATDAELGCSEYLALFGATSLGLPPALDLELERAVQDVCRTAARRGLLASAHDCSEGGLAVTLAESCIAGEAGFEGDLAALASMRALTPRIDALLFGESQSRIVVSCRPAEVPSLADLAAEHGVPLHRLGRVGGDRFRWGDALDLSLEEVAHAWRNGLV